MLRSFIIVCFILLLSENVKAQGNHVLLGIGPSLVYVDNNSGVYKKFKFQVRPALTLSVNKQLTENIGLRGTLGAQMLSSGEYDFSKAKRIAKWGETGQAFDFKGTGYYVDVMPVFTSNPNSLGMTMSQIQFYAGLGFGLMFVQREQKTLENGVVEDGELISGEIITSNETSLLPNIPLRVGFSTNSGNHWDYGLEFVLITTFSSELDGNNIRHNNINPDLAGQILFTVKRYFGRAW